MKNILILFCCIFVILALSQSCEKMMGDFLDKAPGVDVTVDTIFSSQVQLETYMAATYRYGIHGNLAFNETTYTGCQGNAHDIYSDESIPQRTTQPGYSWLIGAVNSDNVANTVDFRWRIRYIAIRRCNILLQRINNMVPNTVKGITSAYIDQIAGEARFIRALNYFEMLKYYGGMPIITKKFELTDNFYVGRGTVEEMVNRIVTDCDSAALLLPPSYSSDMKGRATITAALLLKSRTLLFAASPQYNTATPYLSMDDPANNTMICYGNYDLNRWKLAADAAKAVIDQYPAGGYILVGNAQGGGPDKNYRWIFDNNDNAEIILACKGIGQANTSNLPWVNIRWDGWGASGACISVDFMKKFEKRDGTPQTWDPVGGPDLKQKYAELDYRFSQIVPIVGTRWNNSYPVVQDYVGGKDRSSGSRTGIWSMKFMKPSQLTGGNTMYNDVLYRVAEAYLNYAEALNEFYSTPPQEAYDAVNIIRTRSGQPNLPTGLSQDEFRERVRNERAIELYAEDIRYGDIKRWLIAEQVCNGPVYGFRNRLLSTPPDYSQVSYEVFKVQDKVFTKRMLMFPLLRSEVLMGYLVQNPGW